MQKHGLVRSVEDHLQASGNILAFCAQMVTEARISSMSIWELIGLTSEQIVFLGAKSLSLVSIAAIATGAVMAMQFGNGLQRFGGRMYVPQLVALSVLRELGPVLSSLLLAGRVGSGITAELTSMNVTQQVDAIRALGDSPISTLVVPRALTCVFIFPALTLYADYVAIASSMLVSWWSRDLGIDPLLYYSKTLLYISGSDIWTGALKSAVFGLYIGIVACWKALNTVGGTRAVGEATTWIVVRASIFIVVADFFLTKLFILTVYHNV